MKNDKDAQLAKDLYNCHADNYFSNQNQYPVVRYLRQEINNLIGEPRNKKILFIGCGDAEEARFAIERGAEVAGIDVSEKCIELARKKFPEQKFEVMDFEKTDFENSQFDMIVSIFSVMYKKSLDSVLLEFKRILKKNGEIIIAVPHPIRKMVKYNNMDYFVRGKRIEIWKGNKRFNYYRTIGDYVNAVTENGLLIDKLFEPKVPKEYEENTVLELNHPHHLILKIKK